MRLRRLRAEYRRVGAWRLLDVLAFRLYYQLRFATADAAWEQKEIKDHCTRLAPVPNEVPLLRTQNPNERAVEDFLRATRAELLVARCKWLLHKTVYATPTYGTFVLHPGICPQYRNAHGCFWALANDDLKNVGLTLLQVDDGIDTGPVYGFFRYAFDELTESHIRIQHRVLLENLDAIQGVLLALWERRIAPTPVAASTSRNWGQPWLSAYWRWQRAARQRAR